MADRITASSSLPMTILMIKIVTVLAFYERISGLNVERFTNYASDPQRIGESVYIGDAAAAARRQTAATATFAAAVVGGTFTFGLAVVTAGRGFFFDLVIKDVDLVKRYVDEYMSRDQGSQGNKTRLEKNVFMPIFFLMNF